MALVVGGSLGGMVALELALSGPRRPPRRADRRTGGDRPMAVAWNHLQVELIDRLGADGLSLARQLAMTTYRSEADFDERFGREVEPDGRPSIVSYLDYQGEKLVERFDPLTYRTLAGAMDRHDMGAGRGGQAAAFRGWPRGRALTGIGIEDDILYGPRQVRALVDEASDAGVGRATARSARTRATTRSWWSGTSSPTCCARRWAADRPSGGGGDALGGASRRGCTVRARGTRAASTRCRGRLARVRPTKR